MRKVIPIANVRRLNREAGGLFFSPEHGSSYSRSAWIDARKRAWFWYTNDGSIFRPAVLDIESGRVLPEYLSESEFYTAADAVVWIKAQIKH